MMKLILFMFLIPCITFKLKIFKFFLSNYCFLLSIFMMLNYKSDFCWFMIYGSFGLDKYSYFMIIFMFWLFGLVYLSMKNLCISLFLINLSLMLFLYFCFSSMHLMIFYIFFEVSLIPIYLMILGWGVSQTRVFSGVYMLMYTVLGSMPMLLMIFYMYMWTSSMMIEYYLTYNFDCCSVVYILLISGFLIKLPLYMYHTWLPKAHVDAPCFGSMILAGILLKLGGYGLLRVLSIVFEVSVEWSSYYISLGLMGAIISSIICIRQSDLKMLVAYSSVVHMSMMVSGLMTLSLSGFLGSYYMMIAHGLCSSGLFYIVNMSYERFGSRLIYMNKGSMSIMPSVSMWWFFLCISNMAAPISLNLFSEIMLINSLVSYDTIILFYIMLICFFSAVYSIYLFSFTQHGGTNFFLCNNFNNGFVVEFFVVFLHWFPLNFLIFVLEYL